MKMNSVVKLSKVGYVNLSTNLKVFYTAFFMKDYKELAKNLLSHSKTNVNNFFEEKKLIELDKEFDTNKSFYEQNKEFVLFVKLFGFICQIATIVSSYTYFLSIVNSIYIVVPILLIIEIAKYQILKKIYKGYLQDSIPVPLLLVFLVFLTISVVASVLGGGEFGNDISLVDQNEIRFKNERNEVIKTIDSDIENLKNGISLITKRNSYNGQIWIVGTDKKLIQQKENLLNLLTVKKDSVLNELNKQKTLKETEIVSKNEANTKQFRLIFALCDFLFILSTCYVTLFNYKTVLERTEEMKATKEIKSVEKEIKETDIERLVTEIEKRLNQANVKEEKKIGFDITAINKTENVLHHGNVICKVCGKAFKYSNTVHTYCSIKCKNKFHNNKK